MGNGFTEPTGRGASRVGNESGGKNKTSKPLDTQKRKTKNAPNVDIGDIIKKMTTTLPELTDIETPGKDLTTHKAFPFPRQSPKVCQANKITKVDDEILSEGDSTIKEEEGCKAESASRKAPKKVVRKPTSNA